MKARTKTINQRKTCIRWLEANREQRQELARLRHGATLENVGERKPRYKVANQERLKGKGLFYCASPLEREREIQRRLCEAEANRENR